MDTVDTTVIPMADTDSADTTRERPKLNLNSSLLMLPSPMLMLLTTTPFPVLLPSNA